MDYPKLVFICAAPTAFIIRKSFIFMLTLMTPIFYLSLDEFPLKNYFPKSVRGFACLQGNETANTGNLVFIVLKAAISRSLDREPVTYLREDSSLLFYGAGISRFKIVYTTTQAENISHLSQIAEKRLKGEAYHKTRTKC